MLNADAQPSRCCAYPCVDVHGVESCTLCSVASSSLGCKHVGIGQWCTSSMRSCCASHTGGDARIKVVGVGGGGGNAVNRMISSGLQVGQSNEPPGVCDWCLTLNVTIIDEFDRLLGTFSGAAVTIGQID